MIRKERLKDLKKKGKFFGPYPNAKAAKATVDMLNKIYALYKDTEQEQKQDNTISNLDINTLKRLTS